MKRLTKYEPSDKSMFPYRLKDEELSTELDSIHKLGQLEDIEEELGIYLITLFKALKNGIYCKIENKIEHISAPYLTWHCKKIYICDICNLNDYGKTWALTKEDLENEK